MARNPMQDIVPGNNRSIRNVPVPNRREVKKDTTPKKEIKKPVKVVKEIEEEVMVSDLRDVRQITREETIRVIQEDDSNTISLKRESGSGFSFKKLLIPGGVVAVVVAVVLIMNSLHAATVTVTPRKTNSNVNHQYSTVAHQTVTLSAEQSVTVKATGQKQVDTRATGTIVIYNNYSTAIQRLVKNTRFQTPEGLVYRITESVSVPGKKGTVPGSVEATIIADEAGSKYNVGLKDFVIPGFKGDPRYDTFYGRGKTVLAGGFSGMMKVVSDTDRKAALDDMKVKISADLIKQVEAKKTADQVFFDKAYKIDFTVLPEESASETTVLVKEKGTITATVFDKKVLSSAIATDYIKDYKGEPIVITNIDDLVYIPGTTAEAFALSGNASFEWIYDEAAFKQALAGKPKANMPVILQKFQMIEKTGVSMRPIWKTVFPKDVKEITIKKS